MINNNKISLTIISLLLIFPGNAQEWQMPPANVEVAIVEMTDLAPSINIPANVISKHYGWVSAETTGRVGSIMEIGTEVKKGDVIASVNTITLRAQRKEQLSAVASYDAQIKYLRNQVKRLHELRAKNIAAESQLDETQSQLDMAISDKASAEARLAQVDIGLAASKLRAQFDGTITQRGIQKGEWASPGQEVIRVVDLANKEVVARTAIANISYVETGSKLYLSDGAQSGTAELIALVPFGEISDGIYELRLKPTSGDWPIGSSVTIQVPQSQSESVISVPRDAILLRSGGSSVIKVNDDNSFERIQVRTGLGNIDRIAVSPIGKELSAGDRVIIRGGERLQDGQSLNIKN